MPAIFYVDEQGKQVARNVNVNPATCLAFIRARI
jgi:hypothetical protein